MPQWLVVGVDRNFDLGHGRLPPRRRPKGEGDGPKNGFYWLRDDILVAITGTANEIVALSGQVVLLNPSIFNLSVPEVMQWLTPYGTDPYSAAAEYQQLLSGMSLPLLFKASRIVYEKMLLSGWAWVYYGAPALISFAFVSSVAKSQIAAAAEHFALLQIDKIRITLVTSFTNLSDRMPHMSGNKTLNFERHQFVGFAGPFGGVIDWTNGKEAPADNYLYLYATDPTFGVTAVQANIKTSVGYRKRWAIVGYAQPPGVRAGQNLIRVPVSIVNKIEQRKSGERGLSSTNQRGMRALYSDRCFTLQPIDLDVSENGRWRALV